MFDRYTAPLPDAYSRMKDDDWLPIGGRVITAD